MHPDILLIWANFGPYHLARLAAAQDAGRLAGLEVGGLELAARETAYAWQVPVKPSSLTTLFPHQTVEEISPLAYIARTWGALQRLQPEVLAISGYTHPAMLTALAWADLHGKIAILMSESKADDQPRRPWKEAVKRFLLSRCAAALVGGRPQQAYAVSLGMPAHRVFRGYDVVDNDHFAAAAAAARREAAAIRRRLHLPRLYFLTVTRFIEKKNLFRLLEAYRLYRRVAPTPWDLVLAGWGPLVDRLKEQAATLPGVHFPGFQQASELPAYYGLASGFILASSHYEQWGLVVNEAMACGLPVLVSRACGCAPDLVREGVNGFTFDPFDVPALAGLMARLSSGGMDLQAMGEASRAIISGWTPQVFAANLLRAVEAAQSSRRSRKAWWPRPSVSS